MPALSLVKNFPPPERDVSSDPVCPVCRSSRRLAPLSRDVPIDLDGRIGKRTPAGVLFLPRSAWDDRALLLVEKGLHCGRHGDEPLVLVAGVPAPRDRSRLEDAARLMAARGWKPSFVDGQGRPLVATGVGSVRQAYGVFLDKIEDDVRRGRIPTGWTASGLGRACRSHRDGLASGRTVLGAIDFFA